MERNLSSRLKTSQTNLIGELHSYSIAIKISKYLCIFCDFSRKSLGDRLKNSSDQSEMTNSRVGSTQMSFNIEKKSKYNKQRDHDLKKHREERKRVIRPIKSLHLKKYVPRE